MILYVNFKGEELIESRETRRMDISNPFVITDLNRVGYYTDTRIASYTGFYVDMDRLNELINILPMPLVNHMKKINRSKIIKKILK
jgi:hypothetical protein